MHSFPKDENIKRLVKFVKVKRANFTLSPYKCICEDHFTPDSYEGHVKRSMGFTKRPTTLKQGPVTTIKPIASKGTVSTKNL